MCQLISYLILFYGENIVDVKNFAEIALLWQATVPEVVRGHLDPLHRIVKDHMLGIRLMADISARCLKGSTLMHTAVHFEDIEAIKVYIPTSFF